MSEDTKAAKETRCRELLEANPELTMKEANVTIREEFGTGVAPTTFSKIKKELGGDEAPASKPNKKPTKEAASEKPKAEKAEESEDTQESSEEASASEEKEEPKQGNENPQEEEAQPVVEEEEEIDPNLPKFPVHLEILVPTASTVHLAGSFNRWRTDEFPMSNSGEGFWVFDGELPQGEWHYKFVVDGRIWFLDVHKRKVTDRTGVSHPIQVGDPLPKEEDPEEVQGEESQASAT